MTTQRETKLLQKIKQLEMRRDLQQAEQDDETEVKKFLQTVASSKSKYAAQARKLLEE